MKKTAPRIIPFILTGLTVVFSACPKQEDYTDDGREAAIEFCKCYEESTNEECLEELKDKYGPARYLAEEFIEAFNKTNTCDIELIIEQEK